MLGTFVSLIETETPAERERLRTFYEKYERTIYNIAYAYTADRYDAEEVTQTVILKVARHADSIDLTDSERTPVYVTHITRNLAVSYMKEKNEAFVPPDLYPDPIPGPKEEPVADEHYRAMYRVLAEMPSELRDVLTFYFLDGFTFREIADVLSRSVSTVRAQYHKGMRILRQKLREATIHD